MNLDWHFALLLVLACAFAISMVMRPSVSIMHSFGCGCWALMQLGLGKLAAKYATYLSALCGSTMKIFLVCDIALSLPVRSG